MGYLNNASVSVDAILTTKGRELLAKGGNANGLDIRYFALGDDEVNYDLWNPGHPLGSDYYGIVIENMPVLEASPIPEQNLKTKLITLARDTKKIIYLSLAGNTTATVNLKWSGFGSKTTKPASVPLTIATSDAGTNNATLGYTYTYDPTYFTIKENGTPVVNSNVSSTVGDSNLLTTVIASGKILLVPKDLSQDLPGVAAGGSPLNTKIYVDANEIGGRLAITVNLSQY